MTKKLIAPHGGELIVNMVSEAEQASLQERIQGLFRLTVDSRQLADLEMLAVGGYSPLNGFMKRDDYLSVVNEMHLSNGLPWSIPITLAITKNDAAQIPPGSELALVDAQGTLQAVMVVEEKYAYDKQLEARKVYRTTDEAHPGVKILYQQGEVLLGGPVRVVSLQQQMFEQYRYTPAHSRQRFSFLAGNTSLVSRHAILCIAPMNIFKNVL